MQGVRVPLLMLDYSYRRGFDTVYIDGDCISLVELILHPIINLNFCVARNWLQMLCYVIQMLFGCKMLSFMRS